MLKKIWQFLQTPIFVKNKPKVKNKLIINLFCRYDFPELKSFTYTKEMLNPDFRVVNLKQLCHLFFTFCPKDNNLLVIQDYTNVQPEYIFITEQTVPSEVLKRLYAFLPNGMILTIRHREYEIL